MIYLFGVAAQTTKPIIGARSFARSWELHRGKMEKNIEKKKDERSNCSTNVANNQEHGSSLEIPTKKRTFGDHTFASLN